jgi:hypothetical protein
MNLQKTLSDLLGMLPEERKAFIKAINKEERQSIVLAMGLPKNISQKSLCKEIEETARFIKISKSKG